MKRHLISQMAWAVCILFLTSCSNINKQVPSFEFQTDVEYYKLQNNLKVVLNQDDTRPTVTVAVYYNIGFRNEELGKTGFAHLFEHFMFQGSENLGKGEYRKLVELNGGRQSASTRFDFTNYFQGVPKNLLENVLWAESDRMRGLRLTQSNLENQISVVKTEVDVTVNNLPYGSFPWLDMPQLAFDNWYNAHNFYGDLTDLDSVTLEDANQFFSKYYTPNNAVLVVSGDFEKEETKEWIKQYFQSIPERELEPTPDFSEQPQSEERVHTKIETRGVEHAFAFSYRMPPRNSPDYYAMGLINQLVLKGQDSWLNKALMQQMPIAFDLDGGINQPLGNMFNYSGAMLWTGHLFYSGEDHTDEIVSVLDQLIEKLQSELISENELRISRTKLKSEIYSELENWRFDFLASFALFDNNPNRINSFIKDFDSVTPEQIRETARKYLSVNNRTRLAVQPRLENKEG